MNDENGWMQIGSIHVSWSPIGDEIKITDTATNMPPMRMDAKRAMTLRKILNAIFSDGGE